MTDDNTIGVNLRRIRQERDWSQETLAEKADLSKDLIAKLEQGRRTSCRLTSLMKLANALDVDLTDLSGKRERLGTDRDGGSVLAIRDAVLSPSLLPGMPGLDADDAGEPTPLPDLQAAVSAAWVQYWRGDFGPLTAAVPGLITESRLTCDATGLRSFGALVQTYQLAANLMIHLGKLDLAAIAAERAVVAAATTDDQLQWASGQATYAWVLEHQARPAEAEALAVRTAEMIEPNFSAPTDHVAVWGNLLISAIDAGVLNAGHADDRVSDYISLAAAGAERIGSTVSAYQTTFGPTKVAVNEVHAQAISGQPGKALKAAKKVDTRDLSKIARGHYLLDLAQAHLDGRQHRSAVVHLEQAAALSPVWFRHQGMARSLVRDIREVETRPSAAIRRLAKSVGLD